MVKTNSENPSRIIQSTFGGIERNHFPQLFPKVFFDGFTSELFGCQLSQTTYLEGFQGGTLQNPKKTYWSVDLLTLLMQSKAQVVSYELLFFITSLSFIIIISIVRIKKAIIVLKKLIKQPT